MDEGTCSLPTSLGRPRRPQRPRRRQDNLFKSMVIFFSLSLLYVTLSSLSSPAQGDHDDSPVFQQTRKLLQAEEDTSGGGGVEAPAPAPEEKEDDICPPEKV